MSQIPRPTGPAPAPAVRPALPNRAGFVPYLVLVLLLACMFGYKGHLTSIPSVAETRAATGFDADRAVARLGRILGDQRPHPVDSPANDAVRARLLAEITALGQTPVVRDDFTCRFSAKRGQMSCARVRNVLFAMGPTEGKAVLVAAHYDSVPAGPGAADDGSGVASALEIAHLLRSRVLTKPVIFLLTDGEEAGLLGAASFVRTDPWAAKVAFAVNMEARGTGGPAIMFQTSARNGREIAALTHGPVRTVANSMAADIYRMLPNDTDATEFLTKGWDLLNFAFIAPLARYHTPLDRLEYLQVATVGHMGAAALAGIEGYQAAGPASPEESHTIYSDILGQWVLVLPMVMGWVLLGAGACVSAGLLWQTRGQGGHVATLLAPLVAAVCGGLLGFGALQAIALMRAETVWWTASPMAGRAVIYLAGLTGAGLAFWVARRVTRERLVLAAWLWLSLLFIGVAQISPGSMILAAPACGLFALIAVIERISR